MKDYRLTIKVRNNRILKAIEESGGIPGAKWCDENGLPYHKVRHFINMTESPLTPEGEMHHAATKLCDVLNKIPEDLWSNEQLYPLEKNFSELEMTHEQVVGLLPTEQQSYLPDFSGVENRQIKGLLEKAMHACLNENQRKVLELRFGDEELTGVECARRMGVTLERVRQIETKALQKLRTPKSKLTLADVIELSQDERNRYKLWSAA